ncbi:hypothetical protein Q9L58_004668 [Maublancomyces gigas]|uniref:Metallo-beta-lactamase domain-containing protein n=1 Tax=Discina gigas TaxID=1032678 RepID=A0ABR3GK64_9PEZI
MADEELLICTACGTQFDIADPTKLQDCRICDDPRQFVPPSGQSFTTLAKLRSEDYVNKTARDSENDKALSIWTEPKFGIGQRAVLLQTEHGNVLWDLIAYLDQATIDLINSLGGLKAIVISHPHYYTTHLVWAKVFNCPVYLATEDKSWLCREANGLTAGKRIFIESDSQEIVPGVTAVKVGGHFPGSLVLHWENMLFIADSLVTVPSALYHVDRPKGTTSYSFMWSIPNMIPLPPADIVKIWKSLRPYSFTSTHGAFHGVDVRDPKLKGRVLESAKIAIAAMGYAENEIFAEEWQ